MREIKFRIWCKQTDEMHAVERMGFEEGELWYVEDENKETDPPYFMDRNDSVLMQYTGLKDKNGREIYEGDIISGVTKQNLEVVFQQGSFGMNVMMRVSFHKDERKPFFTTLNCYESDDLEVIGNVYEDNHLLK